MSQTLLLLGLLAVTGADRIVTERHPGYELKTDLDGEQKAEALAIVDATTAGTEDLLGRLGLRKKSELRFVLHLFSQEAEYEDFRRKTHDRNTFVASALSFFDDSAAEIAVAWQAGSSAARGELRRQVARHVLREYAADAPIWFEEGLAGYFEGTRTDPYGGAVDRVHHEHLATVRKALADNNFCPLDQLMDLQHVEFYGLAGARNSDWSRQTLYAQSWSLLFYLLHAEEPDDQEFLRMVARRLNTGRWSQAKYRQALSELKARWIEFLQGDDLLELGLLVSRAWERLEQGEYFAARMDASRALSLESEHRSARRVLARAAYGEEDYLLASKLFDDLARERPNDLDALLGKARALLMLSGRTQDMAQAQAALEAGRRASMSAPVGKRHLGLLIAADAAERMDDLAGALKIVRDLLKLRGLPPEVRAQASEREQKLIKRSIGRSSG